MILSSRKENLSNMQKVLFICKPTKIYSQWVEKKLTNVPLKIFNSFLRGIVSKAYSRANPRTIAYCLRSAVEYSQQYLNNDFEIYAIIHGIVDVAEFKDSFINIKLLTDKRLFLSEIKKQLKNMNRIVLLYPDAIGHGFEKVEHIVFKNQRSVFILNGRKRLFSADFKTRLKLKIRIIIEKIFLFEIFFSLLFPVIIIPYLLFEKITRKRSKSILHKKRLKEISLSTEQPTDEIEPQKIAEYWSSRPQTYGSEDGKPTYVDENGNTIQLKLGDKEFFNKVDETFYSWNKPLHIGENSKFIPFTRIFNYEKYKERKVLEIGCGMGTMAMNWAQHGADLYAVDLNPVSVEQTKRRFKIFNLYSKIRIADARKLPFGNDYFDYIYSWGVLHHSPNIKKSLMEIYRVLTPGGKVGIMLYYRKSILFKYFVKYVEGFLHYENRFLNLLELASRYGDGAMEEGNPYTFPVTKSEILNDIMPQFRDVKIKLFGTDIPWMLSFICFPYSSKIPLFIIKSLARRFGWSMWIEAEK